MPTDRTLCGCGETLDESGDCRKCDAVCPTCDQLRKTLTEVKREHRKHMEEVVSPFITQLREKLAASEQRVGELESSLDWYKRRVELLAKEQVRMRDPERILLCDILANCQLLPDPKGERYGTINRR